MSEIERKKDFFSRYKTLEKKQRQLEAELKQLDADTISPTTFDYSETPVQSSPNGDWDMILLVQQRMEYAERLTRQISAIAAEKNRIRGTILTVADPNECQALLLHFIDGLTIAQTAERMGYSVQHMYRIYSKALRHCELQKKMRVK